MEKFSLSSVCMPMIMEKFSFSSVCRPMIMEKFSVLVQYVGL